MYDRGAGSHSFVVKPFALAVFLVACGSSASAAPPSDAGSGAGAGDVAKNQAEQNEAKQNEAKQNEKKPNETKKDREKKRERRLQRKLRQQEKRSRQVWRGPLVWLYLGDDVGDRQVGVQLAHHLTDRRPVAGSREPQPLVPVFRKASPAAIRTAPGDRAAPPAGC